MYTIIIRNLRDHQRIYIYYYLHQTQIQLHLHTLYDVIENFDFGASNPHSAI